MKSFLIACAVVVAVLIVILGAGTWFTSNGGKRMIAYFDPTSTEVDALNRDFKFVLPPGGKLAEDRLVVWLKTREKNAAYDKKQDKRQKEQIEKGNVGTAMGDAMNIVPNQMKALSRTLRESQLSLDEYVWIFGRVMGALNSSAAAKDPKMAELAKLIKVSSAAAPSFYANKGRLPQSTPLTPEDAQPVLDLLKRHEVEFRKVASITISDTLIPDMQDMAKTMQDLKKNLNDLRTQTEDLKTTRTAHAQ